jgi:hypothetical protein
MKPSWGIVGAVALVSCGASSEKANLVFHVDAPMAGDVGCIGVAGFEVEVTSEGKSSPSGPLPNEAPVLDNGSCRLSKPFSIQGVDIDAPASVVVTGRDGAGLVRVEATGRVDNLRAAATNLQLKATPSPPLPVLVVYRTTLTGAAVGDIGHLTVTPMGGSRAALVDVGPGAYSMVEPAPYGVPGTNLRSDGSDDGLTVFVDATTKQGMMLPRARRNLSWNKNGYYVLQ